jgi:hypothetical protein
MSNLELIAMQPSSANDLPSNLRDCSIDRPIRQRQISAKVNCLGTKITLPHKCLYLVDNALFATADSP